jgi:hypothetical protein
MMQQGRKGHNQGGISVGVNRGELFARVAVNHGQPPTWRFGECRDEPVFRVVSVEAQQVLLDPRQPFALLAGSESSAKKKLHDLPEKLLILRCEERLHDFSDA